MKYHHIMCAVMALLAGAQAYAAAPKAVSNRLVLQKQPGFFRFNFDEISMPLGIPKMGLLGINYLADLNPDLYVGLGGYGSVSGSQGGLFVLGMAGGLHHQFIKNWWADMGVFIGGGGGHSSLVGGGLMLRPYVGVAYDFNWARVGVHYSYIKFSTGLIHSQQVGLDLDMPCNFYSVPGAATTDYSLKWNEIVLPDGKILDFQRNDFSLIVQAYVQKKGTLNTSKQVDDGTISLVGSELDHYLTDKWFAYVKAAGAYHGVPNGYMDVLGGFGYRIQTGLPLTIVPQFGVGAGGGGMVETGGGFILNPQLGVELPLTKAFAARLTGGYLWSPKGNLKAFTGMGTLIYHLDNATAGTHKLTDLGLFTPQYWRIELANQTYSHPQRTYGNIRTAIQLVMLQIDQVFTQHLFFSYQAVSAYSGEHAGGLATGMIGPGVQTKPFLNHKLQLFGNLLVGAAGGGSLGVEGGAVYEPVVGLHYTLTPAFGMHASVGQLKSFHSTLNTPTITVGFTLKFGTLNRV